MVWNNCWFSTLRNLPTVEQLDQVNGLTLWGIPCKRTCTVNLEIYSLQNTLSCRSEHQGAGARTIGNQDLGETQGSLRQILIAPLMARHLSLDSNNVLISVWDSLRLWDSVGGQSGNCWWCPLAQGREGSNFSPKENFPSLSSTVLLAEDHMPSITIILILFKWSMFLTTGFPYVLLHSLCYCFCTF